MKRFFISVAVASVALLMLAACNKDNGGSNNQPAFKGKITDIILGLPQADLDAGLSLRAAIGEAAVGEAALSNKGNFSLTLDSENVTAGDLVSLEYIFNEYFKIIEFTDPNVRGEQVSFMLYKGDVYLVELIQNYTFRDLREEYRAMVLYMYADGETKGSLDSEALAEAESDAVGEVDISFSVKKGWNRIIIEMKRDLMTQKESLKISNTLPANKLYWTGGRK